MATLGQWRTMPAVALRSSVAPGYGWMQASEAAAALERKGLATELLWVCDADGVPPLLVGLTPYHRLALHPPVNQGIKTLAHVMQYPASASHVVPTVLQHLDHDAQRRLLSSALAIEAHSTLAARATPSVWAVLADQVHGLMLCGLLDVETMMRELVQRGVKSNEVVVLVAAAAVMPGSSLPDAFRDTQTSEEQGAGGEGSRREPSMYDLLFSLYDKDCTLVPWKLKDLAMNITLRYLRPWGSQEAVEGNGEFFRTIFSMERISIVQDFIDRGNALATNMALSMSEEDVRQLALLSYYKPGRIAPALWTRLARGDLRLSAAQVEMFSPTVLFELLRQFETLQDATAAPTESTTDLYVTLHTSLQWTLALDERSRAYMAHSLLAQLLDKCQQEKDGEAMQSRAQAVCTLLDIVMHRSILPLLVATPGTSLQLSVLAQKALGLPLPRFVQLMAESLLIQLIVWGVPVEVSELPECMRTLAVRMGSVDSDSEAAGPMEGVDGEERITTAMVNQENASSSRFIALLINEKDDHAADVVAHYNHGHKDRIFLSLAWFIHRRARALMSEQPRKAPLRLNLRTAKRVVGQWTLPQLCANTCAMVDYVLNDEAIAETDEAVAAHLVEWIKEGLLYHSHVMLALVTRPPPMHARAAKVLDCVLAGAGDPATADADDATNGLVAHYTNPARRLVPLLDAVWPCILDAHQPDLLFRVLRHCALAYAQAERPLTSIQRLLQRCHDNPGWGQPEVKAGVIKHLGEAAKIKFSERFIRDGAGAVSDAYLDHCAQSVCDATDTAGDEEREEELGGVRLRRLYLTCIELMCMFATGKELGTHLLRVLVLPPSIRAVQDPFAYINTMAMILALCPQSARDVVFDELQREVCAGHEMDMPSSRCRLLVSLARRILHHGPAQWAAALVPWISQLRLTRADQVLLVCEAVGPGLQLAGPTLAFALLSLLHSVPPTGPAALRVADFCTVGMSTVVDIAAAATALPAAWARLFSASLSAMR